ncbi:serine/threonine protein kinase [Metamycoplasma hyosynoviae]|uniref:non-specific serine/threonine protein kinase n=1 Tax=Metamycoplasma hyosynoviae TaxID=29559 RepID=A0A063YEG8_9BACT|nr:serine/threonine-protein kinase [Metamycoplasma hyosynoviae]ASI53683.1 serine/threonine protein kinase [Metamycoplasma hyosynoviae]KDE42303.1 serine/threonine protein kinase [Metamycoplasma hyosynoviae]KDE42447.1 serine/threonine protein kinase [Metamycoplasma hyosynoviae]KDE44119.1 serine/threonine protein kinase [Metamycoplasma hyosynoviae]KDE44170.1 serine/threonine protein kinase [Metamycoplasma hyosynoviae]
MLDLSKYKNLNKNFEDFKPIGSGGFGAVYSATMKKTGERYAIKILTYANIQRMRATQFRFKNEVEMMKKVVSPYVVQLKGAYIPKSDPNDKEYYLAMELVEGSSLKEKLERRKKLPVDEAISIAREICLGLVDIHNAGIVHRDLKPNNILFNENGVVKLIDFGISLSEESLRVTEDNKLVGSVQYVAPELVVKSHSPSPQSDIYSLGIIMYEMLSGHLPFAGMDHKTIALKHVNSDLPPLEGVNTLIPQAVENIIIKCTAKKLTDRYENCEELYRDLETCLQQERIVEDKVTLKSKKKRKTFKEIVNSKKFTISLIASIAGTLVLLVILLGLHFGGII